MIVNNMTKATGRTAKNENQVSRATASTKRRRPGIPPASAEPSVLDAPSPLQPWHGDSAFARDEVEALLPLSLPEQIADKVCERIMRGDFAAGQRIQEQMLSDSFRVSRGPVREALLLLEREGLIRIEPRRGASVRNLSVAEIGDLFVVRAVLLGLAGRLFTEKASGADLRTLAEGIARMAAHASPAGDSGLYARWSYALTLFMAEKAGNPNLYRMLRSMARQTYRYSHLALHDPARRKDSISRWRKALALACARDAQGVEGLTRSLIDATRKAATVALQAQDTQLTKGA